MSTKRNRARAATLSAAAAGERSQSTYSAFVAMLQDQIPEAVLTSPTQLFGTCQVVDPLPVVNLGAPDGDCWSACRDEHGHWRFCRAGEASAIYVLPPAGEG
jgi:hypothetical protein